MEEVSAPFRQATGGDRTSAPDAGTTDATGPPATWGPLELRHKLGEGSYGEVFRAYDPALDREIALKLARPGRPGERRFLDEGRRLAQVDHPGVSRVHGAALHDGG